MKKEIVIKKQSYKLKVKIYSEHSSPRRVLPLINSPLIHIILIIISFQKKEYF